MGLIAFLQKNLLSLVCELAITKSTGRTKGDKLTKRPGFFENWHRGEEADIVPAEVSEKDGFSGKVVAQNLWGR